MNALLVQGAPISYILLVFLIYVIGSFLYQLLWFRKQQVIISEEIFVSMQSMMKSTHHQEIVKDVFRGDLSFFGSCNSLIKQLYLLKLIVNLSPLLGLLGTVLGIIHSTEGIILQNDMALLGGISESLMTTAMGIIVSVPGLIAHFCGQSLLNRIATKVKIRLVK